MVCDKCFGAANGDCDICERRKRDIDREKLMEALQAIKDTCNENSECETCPLGGSDNGCIVNYYPPKDWEINHNEKVWRALL